MGDWCPARSIRRPVLARAVVGAGAGQVSVAASCATPARVSDSMNFEIRQEWWAGDALPDAKVVRRELAGVPRVEVAGRSKEKVEEMLGHDCPGQSRSGRRPTEVFSTYM